MTVTLPWAMGEKSKNRLYYMGMDDDSIHTTATNLITLGDGQILIGAIGAEIFRVFADISNIRNLESYHIYEYDFSTSQVCEYTWTSKINLLKELRENKPDPNRTTHRHCFLVGSGPIDKTVTPRLLKIALISLKTYLTNWWNPVVEDFKLTYTRKNSNFDEQEVIRYLAAWIFGNTRPDWTYTNHRHLIESTKIGELILALVACVNYWYDFELKLTDSSGALALTELIETKLNILIREICKRHQLKYQCTTPAILNTGEETTSVITDQTCDFSISCALKNLQSFNGGDTIFTLRIDIAAHLLLWHLNQTTNVVSDTEEFMSQFADDCYPV